MRRSSRRRDGRSGGKDGRPRGFAFSEEERLVFKPREGVTVSQWAERHRIVSKGAFQGPWSNEMTPYLVKPMDTFNKPWVRKIFLCAAPQWGKTNFALNCLMYCIDQDPGPAMYIMAGEKSAVRISNRQIRPSFRSTPRVESLMTGRPSDDTTYYVRFKNGMELMMGWSSSPEILGSESCRYVFFDEPGKYPDFSGREADPFSLGEVRTNAYPDNSKLLYFSTPNLDGDAFDRAFREEADEYWLYHARCPVCGHLQLMRFRNIHWPESITDPRIVLRKKLARYACENCSMEWDDHTRNRAVRAGDWVTQDKIHRPVAVAFGPCPSWTSPFVSLSKAAAAYLRSRQDPTKRMAFITQHKAQSYKETLKTKDDQKILSLRIPFSEGVVPEWAVALTAGIDVQKANFYFVVRAWASDLTSSLIQYGTLSTWADVEALIFQTRYTQEHTGETFGIWRAAMDTGGGAGGEEWTRTEEIYQWIRQFGGNTVFGVKGASRPQLKRVKVSIIDKMARGNRPIPGGLELRILDVDQFKRLFHWRMEREEGEAQRACLHRDVGMDYIEHIQAEELRKDRRGNLYWKQIRRNNHWFDCEVYAAACADAEWTPSLIYLAGQPRVEPSKAPINTKSAPAQEEPVESRPFPTWFHKRRRLT